MGRWSSILGTVALLSVGSAAHAQPQSETDKVATLKVSGMACSVCASTLEKAAAKIDGVKAAKANQPQGKAQITYDSAKVTPEAIAKALTAKTGFRVEAPKRARK